MTARLFIDVPLQLNQEVTLTGNAHHYLVHVMRSVVGDNVLLFNGKDGEWLAEIQKITKKEMTLRLIKNTRLQSEEKKTDTWLCFAPIKKDKMDFVIQKATELGVDVLQPVLTRRTVVGRVNTDKMQLQAIEASEQCERLSIPQIKQPVSLDALLEKWEKGRTLYYLNERGDGNAFEKKKKVAYLVGPEGGFEAQEIEKIGLLKEAKSVHLGRRILRAETACIAVLAIHNHLCEWK